MEHNPVKTALYVDFDNIYIGLKEIDPQAAKSFATNPARWLRWIEEGMLSDSFNHASASGAQGRRSVLIRHCYLNPRTFYTYRPYFTRSAFSVIDCPTLTEKGKNSSDIRMVMDILDTLDHPTHFDEFIILSGDADFTPVLLRLRGHDRRTAILTIGPAAEAYKAACDRVIGEEVFIEDALGISSSPYMSPPDARLATSENGGRDALIGRIADKVYERASADGEICAPDLPRLFGEFTEFRNSSSWLGFNSLRGLTEALVKRRSDLQLAETDPWKVIVAAKSARRIETHPAMAAESQRQPNGDDLRSAIVACVKEIVAASNEPVLMARVAQDVIDRLGQQVVTTNWAGAETFKVLLQGVDNLGLEMATSAGHPGYLYDPDRHAPPKLDLKDDKLDALPPDLSDFIRRVNQLTNTPSLTPEEYALLFQAIEDVLRGGDYHFTATSKAVRDLCIERGAAIARSSVFFVLRGISYAGHRFSADLTTDRASVFAEYFRKNVITLCHDAQLELTEHERQLMDAWILGGLAPHDAGAGEPISAEHAQDPATSRSAATLTEDSRQNGRVVEAFVNDPQESVPDQAESAE